MRKNNKTPEIQRLRDILRRLRDPETGCSWDLSQTFLSLAPYTLEEAYEVVDAVSKNDHLGLKDELGDLLLQIVYYAQMSEEIDGFNFDDVVESIINKMINRHPHVFGAQAEEDTQVHWEQIKQQERFDKGDIDRSALAGITQTLPALMKAQKIQSKAAKVGFDWDTVEPAMDKVTEELNEISEVLDDPDRLLDEVGDLLFSAVNVARLCGVDAEMALSQANKKFEARFRGVEKRVWSEGQKMQECSLKVLDDHWDVVKMQQSEKRDIL